MIPVPRNDYEERKDLCLKACDGLTPEQVAAIPKLVEWAKWQDADTIGEENLDVFRPFISRTHVHHRGCYDDAGAGSGGASPICGLTTSDSDPDHPEVPDVRGD